MIIPHKCKIMLKLLKDFKDIIINVKLKFHTMGNLIKVHITNQYSNKLLSTNQQERYQPVIRSLLYIVQH